MRENLLHAEDTGESLDISEIATKGLDCTKAMHAELSGAYLRWEIQMLNAAKQSEKLEKEFALLRPHIAGTTTPSESEVMPIAKLASDSFSAEEHRSFLDRCLRSIRGDSQSDS